MKLGHVALLRGVNVGPAKRIAMADLRALVASLGYGDVTTLLNSGNVVFSASPTKAHNASERIEQALATQLGLRCRVTVLSADELVSIVRDNPLLDFADNPSRLHVSVLACTKEIVRLDPIRTLNWEPDVLAVGERVAYMWCASGMMESRLATAAARLLGDAVTTRNWATMLKVHALLTTE